MAERDRDREGERERETRVRARTDGMACTMAHHFCSHWLYALVECLNVLYFGDLTSLFWSV